ncbi:MAG: hypothetical protein ACP5HU_08945 [Phycisphaerae bacterium]
MLEYKCTGCGRSIETSDDMYGQVEPCPYCETRNVVGEDTGEASGQQRAPKTARGALVCAALSFLWIPFLFFAPVLIALAVMLAISAIALAVKANRSAPPDSEEHARARETGNWAMHLSLASLGLLVATGLLLWATGYRPWPGPPKELPGPQGPPENSSTLETLSAGSGTAALRLSTESYCPKPGAISRNGPSRGTRPCALRRRHA